MKISLLSFRLEIIESNEYIRILSHGYTMKSIEVESFAVGEIPKKIINMSTHLLAILFIRCILDFAFSPIFQLILKILCQSFSIFLVNLRCIVTLQGIIDFVPDMSGCWR